MKNNFKNTKKLLLNQFENIAWSETNALSPSDLLSECKAIEKEFENTSHSLTHAKIFACILKHAQICVQPFDYFAEKIRHDDILIRLRQEWKQDVDNNEMSLIIKDSKAANEAYVWQGDVDFGHAAPDWDLLMALGFNGLLSRARKLQSKKGITDKQFEFYQSCIIVLEAVKVYLKRLANEALIMSVENEEMQIVANNLNNLSEREPQTMHEALQLIDIVYMLMTCVTGVNVRSLGGLDRILLPFFQRDLLSGQYNKEDLILITKIFFCKLNSYRFSANIPFYLGGSDCDGNTKVNEMSYILIDVHRSLKLFDPKIHIRLSKSTPHLFIDKILDSIRNGQNSFVFINDEVTINAYKNLGVASEEACNYLLIGCYEPCIEGKELPCTCAGTISFIKAVEIALFNGLDPLTKKQVGLKTKDASDFKDFDDFYEAVKRNLAFFIDKTIEKINAYEKFYIKINPSPLLSSMLDECLESGKDIYDGGAKYNNTSINVIGIGTAVDSLFAIKKAVFEEGLLTMQELINLLKTNWKDSEMMRLKLLKYYPKFGNGDDEIDMIAQDFAAFASSLINGRKNGRGGGYRCGLFSIDWNVLYGKHTGATPDGKYAFEPLSRNLNAGNSRDYNGVTALMQSVTKIDATKLPNGSVLDIMLHPSVTKGDDGLFAMHTLLRTYMDMGGFGIHFNVFDANILRKAQSDPTKYSTLQVRVCGWNAYFVNLSATEQNLFIQQADNLKL